MFINHLSIETDGYWTFLECGREVWTGCYYFGCCWDTDSSKAIKLEEVIKGLMKREKRKSSWTEPRAFYVEI